MLTIDLYFLIPPVVTQISIVVVKLAIPTGIPTREAKAENDTIPVTSEAKISKGSIEFKILQNFLSFLLINSFCFVSLTK